MDQPALHIREVFRCGPGSRAHTLRRLAETWLRTAAGRAGT